MTRRAVFAGIACAVAVSAGAQTFRADGRVRVGRIAPVVVAAGDTATVAVPVIISKGFHVQANPASSEFYIPLEFRPAFDDSLLSWRVVYPPGARFDLEGEALLTYHDSISVDVILRVAPEFPPGKRMLAAKMRYQACDARRCFFPAEAPLEFEIEITH